MKRKIVIIGMIIVIILAIIGSIIFIKVQDIENNKRIETFKQKIIDPDRIVYRNENGKYFEFLKDTEDYNKIEEEIGKSIANYIIDGEIVTDENRKNVQNQECIEFDYIRNSKNYVIPLTKDYEKTIIKLSDSGGKIFSDKVKNIYRIKGLLDKLTKNKEGSNLEYKEYFSRNELTIFQYKYEQQFKEINYKIYQVKVDNYNTYDLYKNMCNLALDENITEETFKNNVVILTVSLLPRISVEVNLGNIKYTYQRLDNAQYQYTVHALVVNRIVNSDCIYNTDLAEIEDKVQNENMNIQYNNQVESLDKEIFVTDFDKFFNDYDNSNNNISKDDAKKIADTAFKEAERVVGIFDKSTENVMSETVKANNFFTRKSDERDYTYSKNIEVYSFIRNDDMGNGVKVYVDKRLGRIIGGSAFGD